MMNLYSSLNNVEFVIFKISKLYTRNVSISTSNYKNYAVREKKIMNKLMYGSSGKKRKFILDQNKPPILPTATSLSKGAYEGKKSVNTKRINVLNKLFMKYITDLMATGECSKDLLGKGIEISRVQTVPDFNGVNVFWVAKGSEDNESLENILNKNAGLLRHELSQLRVIGVVPKINFVKDKNYAKLVDIDDRLRKADFGVDYLPVDPTLRMKSEFSISSKLPEHLKDKITELEKQANDDIVDQALPPMRHDVLGLNHTDIMIRLKRQIKKSKALHRTQPEIKLENESDKSGRTITEPSIVSYPSIKAQKEAFQSFLQKQKIIKSKAKQNYKKNDLPEYELLYQQMLSNDEIVDIEDNDYIDENEENEENKRY